MFLYAPSHSINESVLWKVTWEMTRGWLVWPAGAGEAPAAAGAVGQAAPSSAAGPSSAPGAALEAPALPNGVSQPASTAGGDAAAPAAAAEAGQRAAGAADSAVAPLDELEDGPAPMDARSRDGGRGRGWQRARGGGRKGRGGGGGRAEGLGSTTVLPDAVLAAVRGGFDSCILAAPGSARVTSFASHWSSAEHFGKAEMLSCVILCSKKFTYCLNYG